MNELTNATIQLPENLPDLSRFVLIGREKLNAVRAEIRAIEKVGLAKEVLEQKKVEAQEIAELVTMSEMQIGRMMKEIPKAQGKRTDVTSCPSRQEVETKSETIRDLGFTPKQTAQFQQMADHEPQVLEAIAEAREHDDIVSRAAVMRKIEEKKKPHVTNNSKDDEWYTPKEYIEAARSVMGSIDLDPASNDFANKTVKAKQFFTEDDNGLERDWFGNVWLNPPYSATLIKQFADKVVNSNFQQAIVLVNNATETSWFRTLVNKASAIIFTSGRIKYYKHDGTHGVPLQGQAFLYFGNHPDVFLEEFSRFGWGCRL